MSSKIPETVTCQECNIQYSRASSIDSEDTPLLRDRRSNSSNWLYICFLCTLLCCGTVIGVYLLIKDMEWESEKPYNEICENALNVKLNMTSFSKFELPLDKVLLTEVLGPPCNNNDTCIKEILTPSGNITDGRKPAAAYNFLISPDGLVHEGLGWGFYTFDCDNRTLNVAILGDLSEVSVSSEPVAQLKKLLEVGVSTNKLTACYVIANKPNQAALTDLVFRIQQENNLKYNC